ncbi:uncharacterized protein LOC131038879 isoform X1 [Cryptomeria japonica]|uniref:uncharacterized protein LOC131038879 isoform X1 n=1 Tax=Cryptomeria japonica TaxID=3369 RepID=UPI0027D9F7BC|nr:uncharacterized protein LOC131038879 isoform X1 [Cryptomeria japonica]
MRALGVARVFLYYAMFSEGTNFRQKVCGLQNTEIERFDSFPKSRIPSCGEVKSEDGSKLDSMPNGLGSNSEFGWLPPNNNDFPQVPADISFTRPEATYGYLTGEEMDEYIEQTEIIEEILQACLDSQNSNVDDSFPQDSDADILNGDYIELNDFKNCDSSLLFESEFNNGRPGDLGERF